MNSKNKGNAFERKIAKLLSNKFASHYNKTQSFRRNPDSGSFFGGLNESRLQTHHEASANFGDIIAPPDFKFTIECKHYQSPPGIAGLVSQMIPQWDKWIEQAETDALKANKQFLLVIKYNRVPEIVITNCDIFTGIKYKNYRVIDLESVIAHNNLAFLIK